MAQALGPQAVKHGQNIFLYSNIRTNQVLYSFSRSLNNHASLKQIPFLGKKTVPASLRKDLWQPFAMVEFPNSIQGLIAFRKLREFRRLHETSYPLDIITQTEGPHKGQLLGTKKRGKVLMNQKANSVADLAAVLLQQEHGPTVEQIQRSERRIKHVARMKKQKGADKVKEHPVWAPVMGGVEGVKVRWANVLDAEFAETWPAAVVHDALGKSRYTAAFPPWPKEEVGQEIVQGETEQASGGSRQEGRESKLGVDVSKGSKEKAVA